MTSQAEKYFAFTTRDGAHEQARYVASDKKGPQPWWLQALSNHS